VLHPRVGRFTAGYMLWEVERIRGAGRTPGSLPRKAAAPVRCCR
jgi:hypothetical protein